MGKSLKKKPPAKLKPKKKRPTLSKDRPTERSLRGGLVLKQGFPSVAKMRDEIDHMVAVLMGRQPPPINVGVHTLQEVADGYYARAAELTIQIHRLEADGVIGRGDDLYKFRTGELRDFMELAKRAADLGSRRLTREQMQQEQARTGRDSRGGID